MLWKLDAMKLMQVKYLKIAKSNVWAFNSSPNNEVDKYHS